MTSVIRLERSGTALPLPERPDAFSGFRHTSGPYYRYGAGPMTNEGVDIADAHRIYGT